MILLVIKCSGYTHTLLSKQRAKLLTCMPYGCSAPAQTGTHLWVALLGSLVAQMVKNLPVMQETQIPSLGQKDSLENEWLPTPVFLLGESHVQRSLAGYSLRGHKESDMN